MDDLAPNCLNAEEMSDASGWLEGLNKELDALGPEKTKNLLIAQLRFVRDLLALLAISNRADIALLLAEDYEQSAIGIANYRQPLKRRMPIVRKGKIVVEPDFTAPKMAMK
ncbi:MAG: hypothetical protein WB816_01055 [Methylocystis sp.]